MGFEVDEIKRRVAISTLLGTTDRRIVCPLPSHDDKHPSCNVNHREGLWHCHACGEGGDIFSLLEKRDRLTFLEALKQLAEMAGVQLGKPGADYQAEREASQCIQQARRVAVDYYHKTLMSHEAGLSYWHGRGLSLDTIAKMHLGWSDGKLTDHLQANGLPSGLTMADFVAAGVLVQKGACYEDYFDIRLILPLEVRGQVVNITGRQTDWSRHTVKYKHLAGVEMPHFYNEDAIGRTVWLFEGHPDTLTGIEVGLPAVGVVGTSGMQHPERLSHCQQVYICADNDVAGQKAAEKWAKAILKHNAKADIRFVALPEGVKDFNDYIKASLGEPLQANMEALQNNALSIVQWKIKQLDNTDDLSDLWPYLQPMTESDREIALGEVKKRLPAIGKASLRSDFKAWLKREESRLFADKTNKITGVNYAPKTRRYLNVDFQFLEKAATAHICTYGDVQIMDADENVSTVTSPILLQSTIQREQNGYTPAQFILDPRCPMAEPVTGIEVGSKTLPIHSVRTRWRDSSITLFLEGKHPPVNTHHLVQRIVTLLRRYIWYPNQANYELLAFWAIGTYMARLFDSYPYLSIQGMRGTGKSTALEMLEALCFNAITSVNSSIASTFRLIESTFPTWIRDEAEQFNKKTPENEDEISILNSGYKKGGLAWRMGSSPNGAMDQLTSFEVFSPKVFAGINILNETLLDRSILIKAQRKPRGVQGQIADFNQERHQWEAECVEIRDSIYPWMLTRFLDARDAFSAIPTIDTIANRERELWLPLLALAFMADEDAGQDHTDKNAYYMKIQVVAAEKAIEKQQIQRESPSDPSVVLEVLMQVIKNNDVAMVSNHPHWYPVRDMASKVSSILKEEVGLKYEFSSRQFTRVLEQTGVIESRAKQVKDIKTMYKSAVCVHINNEVLGHVIETLS